MNKVWAVAGVVVKEMSRRKDFYVLFILTAVITLLLGSINLFGDEQVVGYLKEVCLLLIWISTLTMTVVTGARQIPVECETRTIFPLLAKPIRRSQVMLGKFVGTWVAAGLALIVFYAFFAAISASRERDLPVLTYLQVIWMHWIFLALVTALTLLGAVLFSAPSANITIVLIITVGILLLGQHLNVVAARLDAPLGPVLSAIYYAIPHLEFYDFRTLVVHNWPARDWGMTFLASLYGAGYASALLMVACFVFNRKVLVQ